MAAAIALGTMSCDGIFGDIYDEPLSEGKGEYGFIYTDDKTRTGRIYIDATDYAEWHYVDLSGRRVTTTAIDGKAPANWDFAIHRYDAKTNGGKVMESAVSDFQSLPPLRTFSESQFVADEWTTKKITVDMSQMMNGIILYAEDYYNFCLSRWLKLDTSTMPPVYTLSDKVYVLKLSDGTYAALKLSGFMNDAAVKGIMTIDYKYPVMP